MAGRRDRRRSTGGFWVGLLIFLLAVPLLGWNEQRTVKMRHSIGALAYAQGGAGPVRQAPELEGKVVYVVGRAASAAGVYDPVLDHHAPALALRRIVEMYQWREREREVQRTLPDGTSTTETVYDYEPVWSAEPIDSSRFQHREHQNPTRLPLPGARIHAEDARVSGYLLTTAQIDAIDLWQSVPIEQSPAALARDGWRRTAAGHLYRGRSPEAPEIGDARLSLMVLPATELSLVGMQQGETLVPYPVPGGYPLLLQETGRIELDQMYARAHQRNHLLAWLMRIGGFVLMWVGLVLVFSPLTDRVARVPWLGPLVGRAFGLLAFLVAAIAAVLVIAVGWLIARPWLMALMVMGAVLALVIWLRTRRPAPVPGELGSPPPPPLPTSVNFPPPPPR